jgi:hypothetical protein
MRCEVAAGLVDALGTHLTDATAHRSSSVNAVTPGVTPAAVPRLHEYRVALHDGIDIDIDIDIDITVLVTTAFASSTVVAVRAGRRS